MKTRTLPRRLLPLLAVGVLGSCAQYRPAPLDIDRPLRHAEDLPHGPLSFEDAVRFAVAHNPDLAVLRARAAAVNPNPPPEPIEAGIESDPDRRISATLSLDALSLLGLGVRSAERALAWSRHTEACLAHHARAREIAGEIAEAFAIEAALAHLAELDVRVDASAYVKAGLETSAAESATAATIADWEAERAARDAERRANRLALARLLGLPPGADVVPRAPGDAWPVVPEMAPATLIRSRADVQRRIAAFEVADRELRRAVVAQYPSLVLEPGVVSEPSTFIGAVRLRIPIGASSAVVAAEATREAERGEVEAAILDAVEEASEARVRHDAAVVALASARRRLSASEGLLRASKTHLEVASGPVIETIFAADAVVGAARGIREALLQEARARVRAARAAGWPGADAVR